MKIVWYLAEVDSSDSRVMLVKLELIIISVIWQCNFLYVWEARKLRFDTLVFYCFEVVSALSLFCPYWWPLMQRFVKKILYCDRVYLVGPSDLCLSKFSFPHTVIHPPVLGKCLDFPSRQASTFVESQRLSQYGIVYLNQQNGIFEDPSLMDQIMKRFHSFQVVAYKTRKFFMYPKYLIAAPFNPGFAIFWNAWTCTSKQTLPLCIASHPTFFTVLLLVWRSKSSRLDYYHATPLISFSKTSDSPLPFPFWHWYCLHLETHLCSSVQQEWSWTSSKKVLGECFNTCSQHNFVSEPENVCTSVRDSRYSLNFTGCKLINK